MSRAILGDRRGAWRVAAAVALVVGWYAAAAVEPFLRGIAPALMRFVNLRGGNELGLTENVEAACWGAALVIFASLALATYRAERRVEWWLAAFTLFCLLAFGEEISWGQHFFRWRPPDAIQQVNFQHETNVHNLDVSLMVGLGARGIVTKLVGIAMTVGFAAAVATAWIVLPTAASRGALRRWPRLASIPVPQVATRVFGAVAIISFYVVDRFGDVGEVQEVVLPVVALLSALDLRDERRAREVPVPESGRPQAVAAAPHRRSA